MSTETLHTAAERRAFDISDEEMNLLTEALKYHSDGYTEADITVQVCWGANG